MDAEGFENVLNLSAGPVFGNKNLFTGLGIFVDTYTNEDKNREVKHARTHTLYTHTVHKHLYTHTHILYTHTHVHTV